MHLNKPEIVTLVLKKNLQTFYEQFLVGTTFFLTSSTIESSVQLADMSCSSVEDAAFIQQSDESIGCSVVQRKNFLYQTAQ